MLANSPLGNSLWVILSAWQISDINYAAQVIEHMPDQAWISDKGYGVDLFVVKIEATGSQTVILRSNRLTPQPFNRPLYLARKLIERFFPSQASQTHRYPLLQTRQVFPLVHSSRLRLRLIGFIENTRWG